MLPRANSHSFATQREARTGVKTGSYVPAHNHITLHLSDEIDTVKVGGHIYADENEARIPLNITAPEDRPLVNGVPDRSVELFVEGRPPSRSRR